MVSAYVGCPDIRMTVTPDFKCADGEGKFIIESRLMLLLTPKCISINVDILKQELLTERFYLACSLCLECWNNE